jgi:GAF domain-containing protein
MDFDERLHRAFDALAQRLHEDVGAQLDAVRAELAETVRAEREAAIGEASRNARTAAEREITERLASEIDKAGNDARVEALAAHKATSERLTEAVRAIDAAHSLSEILDTLITSAGLAAGRAAIFLPQGSTLKGWRAVGFDGLDVGGANTELSLVEGGMIAEACETGRLIRIDGGLPHGAVLPSFVELPAHGGAIAVPLVMTGQVFAVLYADDAGREPGQHPSWPSSLEVLSRHAARALEAITATRLAQVAEAV